VRDLLVGDRVPFTGAAGATLGLKIVAGDNLPGFSETGEPVIAVSFDITRAKGVAPDDGGLMATKLSATKKRAKASVVLNQNAELNRRECWYEPSKRLDIVSSSER
jgi:hypothetical protein